MEEHSEEVVEAEAVTAAPYNSRSTQKGFMMHNSMMQICIIRNCTFQALPDGKAPLDASQRFIHLFGGPKLPSDIRFQNNRISTFSVVCGMLGPNTLAEVKFGTHAVLLFRDLPSRPSGLSTLFDAESGQEDRPVPRFTRDPGLPRRALTESLARCPFGSE